MSLVLLAHTCSHLQNASMARLGLTSVPLTKQLHALLLQLQKHGYVNNVAIAGPTPPPPSALAPIMSLNAPAADIDGGEEEWSISGHVAGRRDRRFDYANSVMDQVLGSYNSGKGQGAGAAGADTGGGGGGGGGEESGDNHAEMSAQRTSNNHERIATSPLEENNNVSFSLTQRRLWISLKYHNHRPVLSKLSMISKPTRRYWMGVQDLEGLCLGQKKGHVRGLKGVGETMFVTSDRGLMDVREAVERRLGGMLLCRINGI